jgi:MurNAc alpha-1-phosphate uridylyltransferase
MKINTALILCAGFGRRLDPLTLTTPKPLLRIKEVTMLERCINLIIEYGVKKILLNTFHLENQIIEFIMNKKFPIDIRVIKDGRKILDTGGGILNMIENSQENDFIIFNPDTLWDKDYISEINKMSDFYFSNDLDNILLLADRKKSFDINLKGDFNLKNNLLKKNGDDHFIYIGCQILNRSLFERYKVSNFSISEIWNDLLKQNKLNGFESFNNFYHLTNLETFKRLKDF